MSIGMLAQRPMTADQARATIDAIKERVEDVRELVLELHEREGWKSLGYKSWRDCVTKEFGQSQTHLYRQLQAALIEREISPIGEKSAPIPEGQIRPLAKLPTPEARKEAFEEAKENAKPGKVTAKDVQEAVDKRVEPRTRVNGVESQDPTDIAAARAKGRIPVDAVVEITEPEDETQDVHSDDGEPVKEELSDEEWLESLPIRASLSETCRDRFDRDALGYRQIAVPLGKFRHAIRSILKAADRNGKSMPTYLFRVQSFLRLNHPKHWTLCPKEMDGGCGGKGVVGMIGSCPKCFGGGYKIS